MYDVIVVGAGPAGCAAAKLLAGAGMRVLLAERHALPRYKSCSGQLIAKSLELVRAYFGADAPRSADCAPAENRGIIVTDARGDALRFEQRGRNVWRAPFDAWLAEQAAGAGAELRENVAALSCAAGEGEAAVRLQQADGVRVERARWVIDCGGAAGGLRRGARVCIATYQTFNRGAADLDPRYFYAFLQPELSGYDAWCNVKDGMFVLGVSAPAGEALAPQYARFLDYMRARHGLRIREQLGVDRWAMPRMRPGCPVDLGAGRVLRAGEAAGFLNPMGEGISAALESGHCAAEAVLWHFDDPGEARRAYQEGVAALHAYMRRQWNLAAGMGERFAEMKL